MSTESLFDPSLLDLSSVEPLLKSETLVLRPLQLGDYDKGVDRPFSSFLSPSLNPLSLVNRILEVPGAADSCGRCDKGAIRW